MTGPQLNVGNLVGYFTLDTSDLDRARTSVAGGLGDIRTQGARAAGTAGAAIGAALTGAVVDAARDIGRAGQRAGDQFADGVADGTRTAVTAVDRLRAQAVIAGDKSAAAMARYQQATADAAAGNASAARDARRFGAEATIAAADAQRAMEQFETAARDAGTGAVQAGKDAEKSFGGLGEAAKGALVGLGLGTVLAKAMNADDASRKLSAQLHLSADEAGRFGKDAGALFSGNFAGSLDEANDAIRSVVSNIGGMRTASDADLQSITGQVSSLAQTFDVELGGTAIAVGQLMKTGLAKNAQEALDIVTAGFQAGDDKAGDFLDTINEYSVQWQKLGIDGKTAVGLVGQALQNGARDSDVAGDALKEFAIRVSTVSTTTTQGFEALGLSASDMYGQFGKGGPTAAAALQTVLDKVKTLKDPVDRATVATDLFGSQWEDLGSSLMAFDPKTAAAGLGDLNGRAQDLTNTVGGSASGAITSFWNSLQTTATTIGGELLPQLTPLLPALQDIAGAATTLVGGFLGLPEPLKNAGLALGAILLFKGPLLSMFGQVQARAAAMAVSLAASNGIAGAAGAAAGGVSRLAGFLGGPWGVAIGLGVTALATFAHGNDDSAEAVAANKARIDGLAGTLDTITGKLTTASAVKIGQDWIASGVADQFKSVQGGVAAAATSIVQGGAAIEDYRAKLIAAAGGFDSFKSKLGTKDMDAWSQATRNSGVSTDQLIATVQRGGESLDAVARKIAEANKDSADPTLHNVDSIKARLSGLVAGLDPVVSGLKTYNEEVTSSGQASQIAADSIKLQKDATTAAADAEAARLTGMVTTMGTQDALTAAENDRLAATQRATEATKSLSQYVTEQQSGYTAAYRNTMDLQGAQQQLAGAVKAVHDAPTKDFAAMEKSIKGVTDQTSAASTETSAFAIEIDKLTGRNVPLQDATKALNDQVRGLAATFGDAQGIIDAHAKSLVNDKGVIDTTTEAGSKLYDSVTDYSDAYNTSVTAAMDAAGAHATVAQKVAAASAQAKIGYDAFIKQAEGLGVSHDQAVAMAKQMGILDGKTFTPKTLHLEAQDAASAAVDALDKKVQGLQDKTVELRVHAVGMINDAAGNPTVTLQSDGSFRTADGKTGMKDGGPVIGPGSGTSDSITRKLSHGEFVVNALGTARNRKAIEYANNGGIIPGFAAGGFINYRMDEQDSGTSSAFANVASILGNAQSSADRNNTAVDAAVKAAAAAIPKANGGGTEQWRALFMQVAAAKGENPASVQVGLNQMSRESSGNPAAINLTDSNAQAGHPSVGLLQFIPSTFAANADPGYSSNIYDPESQMRAWYNYINRNYGGYAKFSTRGYGAYAGGGEVKAPGSTRSDSGLARVSNGEFVVSQLGTARNRKAIEYANKGGVIPGFASGGYVGPGVSARQLSGKADAPVTERLGKVVDALHAVTAEVNDAYTAAVDSGKLQNESYAALIQARRDQAKASKAEQGAAKERSAAALKSYDAAVLQRRATLGNYRAAQQQEKAIRANIVSQQQAAQQFDRVSAAFGAAKDKLADLRSQRANLASTVADGLTGYDGGITGHADQRTTAAAVQRGLSFNLSKVFAFKQDELAAQRKGLDPQLLAEIAGKGVEGGGPTLRALATATTAQIAGINKTQQQLLAVSASAGNIIAGAQFDPLIRSQQKLVDSLSSTLVGLDKYLLRNGDVMATAVGRALASWRVDLNPQGMARLVATGNKQLARRY